MKIGSTHELCAAERAVARYLAGERYKIARSLGIKDGKMGPQSTDATDLEGIAGEIAFCKIFNLYPDLQIGERLNYDAILSSGVTVDVKTTKYETGRLLAVLGKETHAPDAYALMTGVFPGSYTFRGFMWSKDLLINERIGDLGHGYGYMANQSMLVEVL